METIGFVFLAIGLMVLFAARRIVLAKIQLDETDKKEFELLASGGILAVRIVGFIVAIVGLIFMIL